MPPLGEAFPHGFGEGFGQGLGHCFKECLEHAKGGAFDHVAAHGCVATT